MIQICNVTVTIQICSVTDDTVLQCYSDETDLQYVMMHVCCVTVMITSAVLV